MMKILVTILIIISLSANAAAPLALIANAPKVTDHTFRIFKLVEKLDTNKLVEDLLKRSGKYTPEVMAEIKKMKAVFKVTRSSAGGINIDLIEKSKSLMSFSIDKTLKGFSVMAPHLDVPKTFRIDDPKIKEKMEKALGIKAVSSVPKNNLLQTVMNNLFINTSYAVKPLDLAIITGLSVGGAALLVAECIVHLPLCVMFGVMLTVMVGLLYASNRISDFFTEDLSCCKLAEYGSTSRSYERDKEIETCKSVNSRVEQLTSNLTGLEKSLNNLANEKDSYWLTKINNEYTKELDHLKVFFTRYRSSELDIDELEDVLSNDNMLNNAREIAGQMINYCEENTESECKLKFRYKRQQIKSALDEELNYLECKMYEKKMEPILKESVNKIPDVNVNDLDRNQQIEKAKEKIDKLKNEIKSKASDA